MIRHKVLISLLLSLGLAASVQAQDDESMPEELDTEAKQFSYVVGMDVGNSLKDLDADLDLETVIMAMRDVMSGDEVLLSESQANELKQAFFQKRQQQAAEQAKKQAAANRERGEKFLADNAQKEGVETTDSGLQYEVVEEGSGQSPEASDRVTVHYTGTLIDGTVFDSSRERGEPASFALNQVIPGWTEGLQLMKEGGHYKFYIPSELAYGERGAGDVIEPGSTLIFDVELLEVADSEANDSAEQSQ
jgi:FKBP-type peptidyl-prolyl cis-trans isomerase